MIEIKVTNKELISSIVESTELYDVEKFISELVDYVEGYGYNFRERIIQRLKEEM